MTSKEMEQRSGVPRANIRYYEAEGLLDPARLKNGYREYSEADLEILEKIKLLRRLGVSIEELKALQVGTEGLAAVLDRRLSGLAGERAGLARVEQVCSAMRAEAPGFAGLDAEKYLRALDAPVPDGERPAYRPPLPPGDVLPIACCPFRRFFAREFDWFLIVFVMMSVLSLCGYSPARANALAMNLGAWAILFLLEPLFLSLLGTTPGKALLGLRLESGEGRRLTYGEAFWRMALMAWCGLGLGIPIFNLVQLYRSFKRCMEMEPQPWDEDVAYAAQPPRARQAVAFVLAAGLAWGLAETANRLGQLPPNRGELTAAEFAENFNRQADYLGMDFSQVLNEEGRWEDRPWDGNGYISMAIGPMTDNCPLSTLWRMVASPPSPSPGPGKIAGTGCPPPQSC